MADTNFRVGDSLWTLTRKILDRLNQGITTSGGGGGGGGGGGAVTIADGADTAEGSKADAANTDSTSPWSVISLLKGIWAKLNGGVAVTGTLTGITNPVTVAQATAANLKVSLADTGANATAIKVDGTGGSFPVSGTVTVQQATAANLKVDLLNSGALANVTTVATVSALTDGNVGGKTTVIKDTTAVSTSPAYTSGDAVGGKRTLANALLAKGTGVLESVIVLDRANQKAPLDIYIFDADPTGATITDNSAFVFSTDDLKVIAHISVAAADYVTTNTKAIATESNLGIALKAGGTSLYAAVVTTGTPTYAATTDVQIVFGILQD